MTRGLSKLGGTCGLVAAGTFVIGLVMYATLLIDYTTGSSPDEAVALLVDQRLSLYLWNLIITIVFGIVLVPVVLALRDAVRLTSPALANSASTFGLIWAGLIISHRDDQQRRLRRGERSPRCAATAAKTDTGAAAVRP
jgi:hypothetical protein